MKTRQSFPDSPQPSAATMLQSMPATGSRTVLYACVGIGIVGAFAYANSFTVPFIFDDRTSIVDNSSIRHLATAFFPPYLNGETVGGRPMLNLSFALNYWISGHEVWSYHALNVAIHILAGLLLFGVVRQTLLHFSAGLSALAATNADLKAHALAIASAVAGLWVLHPVQTESVTYIVQRAESLMGLFYLLTLYGFIRGVVSRTQPRGWLTLSCAACLLGMATKEVMVSAPVIVLLYDRTFVSGSLAEACRRHGKYYAALAVNWLLLAALVMGAKGRGGSAGLSAGIGYWNYVATQFEAVSHYLALSIWPHPLIFEHGTTVVRHGMEMFLFAVPVVLVVAGTIVALWRGLAVGFLGAWFLAILAPTSLVPVLRQTMVEHRMYLALAPVITAVVVGTWKLLGRRNWLIYFGAGVVFCGLTIARNTDYQSAFRLVADTAAKRPNDPDAHNNLGLALLPDRLSEAIAEFETALKLDPTDAYAHNNLANALAAVPARRIEVIGHFEAALRSRPDFAEAHNGLGIVLAALPGRQADAIAHFEAALQVKPDYAEAHSNLANELAEIPERWNDAISHYEIALRLKPKLAVAHNGLGVLLTRKPGHLPEAIKHLQIAVELEPNDFKMRRNFAHALDREPNRQEEAIVQFRKALLLKPDAELQNDLGVALASKGRMTEAISEFEKAVKLSPDFVDAQANLANALATVPERRAEAVEYFYTALRLRPNDAALHNNLGIVLAAIPGRRAEAMGEFEKALRLDPGLDEARSNLAAVRAMER